MTSRRVETPDGISWYTKIFSSQRHQKAESSDEYIVLIPSGEGDCHNLTTVALLLSTSTPIHVLTFDMPGFSRTSAPPWAFANVRPQTLAQQIITLLDTLNIAQPVNFFGCSSGGSAVLALIALHPDRVRCGIVHEVPLSMNEALLNLQKKTDFEISAECRAMFAQRYIEQVANDGARKWEDLGTEYHARLAKNFVTWVKGYPQALGVAGGEIVSAAENLRKRPLFWTVGGLNDGAQEGKGIWETNFVAAERAGLRVETSRLRCLHFPAVTVPEESVRWIQECIGKVKD